MVRLPQGVGRADHVWLNQTQDAPRRMDYAMVFFMKTRPLNASFALLASDMQDIETFASPSRAYGRHISFPRARWWCIALCNLARVPWHPSQI